MDSKPDAARLRDGQTGNYLAGDGPFPTNTIGDIVSAFLSRSKAFPTATRFVHGSAGE
jgi:hypothetical protein